MLLALASVSTFAGCGGDKAEQDVEGLLDRAFRQPVKSADVKVDAQLEVEGLQGLERPVRLEATGVYVAAEDTIPEFDIDLKVGSPDTGQTVESGFLSTGDRAFLKFGGEFYEQPPQDIARANRELGGVGGDGGVGALAELGVDPRSWVIDAQREGEDEVAGIPTRHVSAKLDVRSVFADLNKLVERSGNRIGGVTPGAPRPLTEGQLDQLSEVVEDPTFDVYVGKDDEVIRRVSATLDVRVPAEDRDRFSGIEGGTLRISVELSDVNGDQTVEAPADSRPIKDLSTQLGGFGALGDQGFGGSAAPPPDDDGTATAPGTATPRGETPSPDALQLYSDCLDEAPPADTAALQRCNMLLPSRP
ncbi:MAG: hypothetical protein M3356_00810 [Actinomycetota bacterium]|nr:hypothetical protein [Actinomycetota bacterium]